VTTQENERRAVGVFINYRHQDVGHAGRLREALLDRLGDQASVFMDVHGIDAGTKWRERLDREVAQCQAFYAVISPRWLEILEDHSRSGSEDVLRSEIARVLSRHDDVLVVAVLVDGAQLPDKISLPEDLRPLVDNQGFALHERSWSFDVDDLVATTLPNLKPNAKELAPVPSRPTRSRIIAPVALVAIVAVIALLFLLLHGPSDNSDNANRASSTSVPVQSLANASHDSDPRAQIVKLTGQWSEQGFIDAIEGSDTDIVDKYLKSGMKATTLHSNASALLYGFQAGVNSDPVALLKTFQANGFHLDDQLVDGRILKGLDESLPLRFDTPLTPKNYTGGYAGGQFTGSLMLWIVSRASYVGVTDQDRTVLGYLISQHADCKVSKSYLEFNRDILSDTAPFKELYPMIEKCAK
jgi:hypothetical protein